MADPVGLSSGNMIILLATGGTIASVDGPAGRRVGRAGAELLTEAAKVWPIPQQVDVRDTRALVSSALTAADVQELARHCGNSRPVVITHGTDAMEETAFAISLLRGPTDPPVVFTGAQRPFDDPCPDGPRNLAAALAWAGSPEARGTGVSVVFGDEVLPAIGVRKTHTLSLTGFSAPGAGRSPSLMKAGCGSSPPRVATTALTNADLEIEGVEVLSVQLGMTNRSLDAALASDAALVVEGMGAGNAPPGVTARLVTAIEHGRPIVVTSRTGAGAAVGSTPVVVPTLLARAQCSPGIFPRRKPSGRWRALSHGQGWKVRLKEWLRQAGCVGAEPLAPARVRAETNSSSPGA